MKKQRGSGDGYSHGNRYQKPSYYKDGSLSTVKSASSSYSTPSMQVPLEPSTYGKESSKDGHATDPSFNHDHLAYMKHRESYGSSMAFSRSSSYDDEENMHPNAAPANSMRSKLPMERHQSSRTNGSRGSAKGRSQQRQSKSSSRARPSSAPSQRSDKKTIALFGAYGVTGNYFLHLALDAGYHVRALIVPGIDMDDVTADNDRLTLITGGLNEASKVSRVVKDATFVVCMLNDCHSSTSAASAGLSSTIAHGSQDGENINSGRNKSGGGGNGNGKRTEDLQDATGEPTNPSISSSLGTNPSLDLIRLIYSVAGKRAPNCRALLYQASSMCQDQAGSTPLVTNILKSFDPRKSIRKERKKDDRVVQWLRRQKELHGKSGTSRADTLGGMATKHNFIPFIVMRPGNTWDRPSRKKLFASKSLPGLFPITNTDLAELSLNALNMERLYNTCPYVVQDGF